MSVEATITADNSEKNRPSISGSANGTPTVNVNDANDKGVSHNKYQDFNVGKDGVIFNNSTRDGVSQIGGYVMKNSQMKNEARVILNEVTGAKGSYLNGTMEVFGRNADLIIANENGISVNGVSTINANNLTLSTGRVNLDQNGNIKLAVERGNVSLEGTGISTAGLSYFDIISRTATLKGEIAGNADLKVLTGLNDYNPATRTHSVRSQEDNFTPKIAIDGSQLGSMYGNRIQLISTESGAGVSHEGSIAGNNGIEISADGDIRLTNLSAKNKNVSVSGRNIALNKNGVTGIGGISANGDIILSALHQLSLSADAIAENGVIRIHAGSLLQSAAALLAKNASRTSSAIPSIEINVGDSYKITGTLYAVDLQSGHKIDNAQVKLLNGKYIVIADGRVIENAEVISDATLTANNGGMFINAGTLENESGIIASKKGHLVFNLQDTLLNNGLVQANGSIELKGRRLKNSGVFNTTGDTLLTLGTVENSGSLYANNLSIVTNEFDNQGIVLAENGQLSLQASGKADTLNSGILQGKNTTIKTEGTLVNHGSIAAEALLDVNAGKLMNHHQLVSNNDITLTVNEELVNSGNSALVSANKKISITGRDQKNTLKIKNVQGATLQSPQGDIDIHHVKSVENQQATILANKTLTFSNSDVVLNDNGHIQSGIVNINNISHIENKGHDATVIASEQLFLYDIESLENKYGSIASHGFMVIERIHSLFNDSGALKANDDIGISQINNLRNSDSANLSSLYGNVFLDTIINLSNISGGVMGAQGVFSFRDIGTLYNADDALIQSMGDMAFDGIITLTNTGNILSDERIFISNLDRLVNKGEGARLQAVDIIISGISNVINQGAASIVAKNTLKLNEINNLLNEASAFLQGSDVDINAGAIINQGYGAAIVADNSLTLVSDSLVNKDEAMIFSDNELEINAKKIDNSLHSEIAGGRFTIDTDELNNIGTIAAQSGTGSSVVNALSLNNNQGRISSNADLFINTSFLNNSTGSLFGQKSLNINTKRDLNNKDIGSIVSAGKLSIQTTGKITIDQALESWVQST